MKRDSPAVRAYLRKLGNPYASLEMFGETLDDSVMTPEHRVAYRRSENPHAFHFYSADNEAQPNAAVQPELTLPSARQISRALSKAEFRARCRAIFRPYIPAMEKGKLRPHHRDFITRNESRAPDIRFALIAQLQRYDLSSVPGLNSQFNREQDVMTTQKLSDIERSVGTAD